ncbi:PREDICTED: cation/H(+) antiporter 2-like [Tarenaya hassleriana]|uniref:cation/H(+) antiporter 2-like n=1 Tax=Tarenaya hassleriana TaxID=28532 RepID=UPI00053C9D61|nr:PREDICTED: cation/H(+) antiporter 2-like [Tarenaya hassleriana]
MDQKKLFCFPDLLGKDDLFNPLNQMFIQMACILVFSQLFYLLLKPSGQAGPVSQILAGIVLSPTVLSRIDKVQEFFLQRDSAQYYSFFSFLLRTSFMFLIGLEVDSDFMRRNFRRAAVITFSCFVSCSLICLCFLWLVLHLLKIEGDTFTFALVFLVTLSNTASPAVICSIADLKLHTSEIGRLAITCALFMEIATVVFYTVVVSVIARTVTEDLFLVVFLTGALILINKFLAPWLSRRSPAEKYLSKTETLIFFILVLVLSITIEALDINSAVSMFFVGLMFPRQGKSYRTLLQRLSYPIHEFVLPVYFGYIGFRFSLQTLLTANNFIVLVLTVILSLAGKFIGVFGACSYQKIPWKYWSFLSSILSMKGHVGLLLLDLNPDAKKWRGQIIHDLIVAALVITTLISGVIAAFLLRSRQRSFAQERTSLEFHETGEELRVLSCVYGLLHARGAISLVSALSGSSSPFTPLLLHLVPLPKKRKSELLYHEQDDGGGGGGKFNEDDEFATNEGLEINESIDSFSKDSKILIHQVKLVSQALNMHEEICNATEDLRVSIIFLPFHKHQRIDGKTTNDGEEIRQTNHKVLRHAPCSVGIYVDRNKTGFQQPHSFGSVQHVAALFFGGPDDREALSLCKWLINNSLIHLTVIQFVSENSKEENQIKNTMQENNDVFMEILGRDAEDDRIFLEDFYNRYVTTGRVGFIEKHVSNGSQMVTILREIGEMYSLYVVGKGQGDRSITVEMSDWEECPELGKVGDFLASSDLDVNASVLVVQRHRHSHTSLLGDY